MSQPAPPVIQEIPEETHTEHLLRAAATYISAYANEGVIFYNGDDEPATREDLVNSLLQEIECLVNDRQDTLPSISFKGNIVEAGNDSHGQPRMTIHTSAEALRGCGPIPFYLASTITVLPLKR